MKTRFELRVSRPCRRDWSALDGDGPARHCGQCDTTVHDLDALRPEAIVALVRANPGGFCGRYTSLPEQPLEVALDEGGGRPSRAIGRTAAAVLATAVAACSRERAAAIPTPVPDTARVVDAGARPPDSGPKAPDASPSPAAPVSLTRETCERLQSLGYVHIDCSRLPSAAERR